MREPREYEAPLCAEVGGDIWFPEDKYDKANILNAVRTCGECKHQLECAEWGIRNERFGIWGGLTASQRVRIRRTRNIILPKE